MSEDPHNHPHDYSKSTASLTLSSFRALSSLSSFSVLFHVHTHTPFRTQLKMSNLSSGYSSDVKVRPCRCFAVSERLTFYPKDFGQHFTRSRQRSRTMSMFSVSSSTTVRSTFEITKTLSPSPTVSSRPDVKQAYGSFIPVRSAANCLRDFAGHHTTTIPRNAKKRRRVTFQETSSPVSSDDEDFPPSLPVSFVNRPFPTPKRGHQSPVMLSPPMTTKTSHRSPSGMHPVLAKLERESKLCTQIADCSTCRKSGYDYPRCSRCGVKWCSRTCRLVAGKRHICPPNQ